MLFFTDHSEATDQLEQNIPQNTTKNITNEDKYQHNQQYDIIDNENATAYSQNQNNTQNQDNTTVYERKQQIEQQSNITNQDQQLEQQNFTSIIDKKYWKKYNYNYKKENIHKLRNCKKERKNFMKELRYGQKENYYQKAINYKFKMIQKYGEKDRYKYGKRLGEGYFASVFLAQDLKGNNQTVVIKNLNSIKIEKIKKEFYILKQLKNCKQIVDVVDIFPLEGNSTQNNSSNNKYVFNYKDTNQDIDIKTLQDREIKKKQAKAGLVFNFISSKTISHYNKNLEDLDLRYIMYDSLKAIAYAHSKGIMHRDIKQGNIIYNKTTKTTQLIDFGIADYVNIGQAYHYRTGTKPYKPPEVLLNYTCYDFGIDTWGIGVVFGQMMFKKRLFTGEEDIDILKSQVKLYGSHRLISLIKKYNLTVDHYTAQQFPKKNNGFKWIAHKTKQNEHLISKESINLLNQLLQFDFSNRISPQDALSHPYFDRIRLERKNQEYEKINEQQQQKQNMSENNNKQEQNMKNGNCIENNQSQENNDVLQDNTVSNINIDL